MRQQRSKHTCGLRSISSDRPSPLAPLPEGEGEQTSSSLSPWERAGVRVSRELCWQLHRADDPQRLAEVLSTIEHFMVLYEGETQYEVLGYWAELGDAFDMEA